MRMCLIAPIIAAALSINSIHLCAQPGAKPQATADQAKNNPSDRETMQKIRKALMDDKKLHKDLKEAAEALRDAGAALRSAPKKQKKRSGGLGRKLLVLVVGAGVALAVSGDLRSKVLDALFGKEEEFDYTSTTSPATAAPPAQPVSST